VHPASVTSAVKRLEREGLIQRQMDETDNRIVLATLLPKGRDLLVPATNAVNEVFESLGLDDNQLDVIVALLDPIRHSAGDPVEPAR
jgi:DNA-binding MarR family transcriptional regulator